MHKLVLSLVVALLLISCQGSPLSSSEASALVQQQAQQDAALHHQVISNKGYTSIVQDNNGGFGVTFDNGDKKHRDRGYGFEKAYAYSRDTAFFDFYDDKGALNAKDLVEKLGKSDFGREEDLLKNISS